jgi:hypothetical protein
MKRDEFLKRFKHGSEPWRILVLMAIAKEKAVAEKVRKVAACSQHQMSFTLQNALNN